jgi:hypothetical protein
MPADCAIDNNVSFKNNFESNNHTLSDNTPLPTGGIRSRNTAGGTNLQLLSSNGSSQSSNCSYHKHQCNEYLTDNTKSYDYTFHVKPILEDNNLIFCSEFPHGYSLKQGRLMYYYGKHILYNIPHDYPYSTLTFKISVKKDEFGDNKFSVKNSNQKEDETLTSAILDVFDFDLTRFQTKYLKNYDLSKEIDNQISEKPWLVKDKTSELFII